MQTPEHLCCSRFRPEACRQAGACGCGLTSSAAPRRFAQALNATYGCVPSNADHCCLGLAQSSQLGQYGLLGLRPVYDACSQLPGCSYQARLLMGVRNRGSLIPKFLHLGVARCLLGWTPFMCSHSTCSRSMAADVSAHLCRRAARCRMA